MYAMLSLDLNEKASREQRDKFNDYLEEKMWIKMPEITTTWYAYFDNPAATESEIIDFTKNRVKSAAQHAKVVSYHAVVNVGNSLPKSFS